MQPDDAVEIVDQGDGSLLVAGRRVWGFVQSWPTRCGHPNVYSERYDAHFCPVDNVWLEKHCSDRDCKFCGNRPRTPFEADLSEPND